MTTPARAALAGNPSDGFGGAVCAVIVPGLAASARATPGGGPLVSATIERFGRDVAALGEGVSISVESTIPRSVGLAGSSAIVIDVIKLLCELTATELRPMEIAELAHGVERVDLSIAGGWQDQLIQAHGYPAFMDFRHGRTIRRLDITTSRDVPLYLAWDTTAQAPSGDVHDALQADSAPKAEIVAAFATAAEDAAVGIETGNVHRLKSAINASFDLRAEIMELDSAQAKLISRARAHGACANYAGSGGAIVGVLPKNGEDFLDAMRGDGYEVLAFTACSR